MDNQAPLFSGLPEPCPEEPAGSPAAARAPRVLAPNRRQLELRAMDLEATLGAEHPARAVWAFVEGLDLSALYAEIAAVEGRAGRPAIDPRLLMALWLYATVEGVGSARALARLTEQHDAYRWICGGVSVNYHTLAEFRVVHVGELDRLLTDSVTVLLAQGVVTLERVAQDGMRTRAHAGTSSFRRRSTLERCRAEAQAQVAALRAELEADPAAGSRRERAARERAAAERARRVSEALAQLAREQARQAKRPRRAKQARKPEESAEDHAKRTEPRASTTDPEARTMKMADGGFRPGYNLQFATDTASQVVVGVTVSSSGSDMGELPPMLEQLQARYGRCPEAVLVDGGYPSAASLEQADARQVTVYAPVPKPKRRGLPAHCPRPSDPPAVGRWRQRMATAEAQRLYRERAATAEWVNAQARRRGLYQLLVRGLAKVRAVALWHALAHNLMHTLSLQRRALAAG